MVDVQEESEKLPPTPAESILKGAHYHRPNERIDKLLVLANKEKPWPIILAKQMSIENYH